MLRNKLTVDAPKPSVKDVVGNEAELSARKTDSISREKQSIRKELESISEHTKTSEKKRRGDSG